MSITEQVVVTLADVEVSDDYQVELVTPEARKGRTVLSPDQAAQLARDLEAAALEAVKAIACDGEARAARQVAFGFDVDTVFGAES